MLNKKCSRCGKVFFKTPNISLNSWGTKRRFCSKNCANSRPCPTRRGIKIHLWKKNIKHQQLHKQVYLLYGKPKKCVHCGATKNLQWANKSNKYIDQNDFIELCASCHKKYDNKMNGNVVWNKGLKGEEYKKHFLNGIRGGFTKGQTPWNKYLKPKNCLQCGELFQPKDRDKKYCSNECYWSSPAQKKGGCLRALGKRWSLKFEKCILCGKTENKHQGEGLCTKCYMGQWYNKTRKVVIPNL